MRLSDILSKPPMDRYEQIEGFLVGKKGNAGQQVKLTVGQVALNFFCSKCNDMRTFTSKGDLSCVFVNKQLISIDCVLTCICNSSVEAWFLVECEDNICGQAPKVRILKKSIKLSENVKLSSGKYGEFSELLDKAERAYMDNLGAGSIVYLRKIFENITIQIADSNKVEYKKYENGNPKKFYDLLTDVDSKYHIIPNEFAEDGYRLFRELSNVVHGGYNEELGLEKFESLKRLVIGILDNIKNREELKSAIEKLGWKEICEVVQ